MDYKVPFKYKQLSYDESLEALNNVKRFGISPMLETVEDMLEEMGNPDLCFRSLQVAGTNGKTSTSRFTAAILNQAGLKTALYTSPHLVEYPERMEIGGKVVSYEQFAFAISVALEAGERVNTRRKAQGETPYDVTVFDLITTGAAALFAKEGVDACVFECGLGARWDATSAIKSIEAVAITGVGLDHTHILGTTREAIAQEKACAIKPGRSVVLGVGCAKPDSVEDIFLDTCKSCGITPVCIRPEHLQDCEGEIYGDEAPRTLEDVDITTFVIKRFPGRIGGALIVDVKTPKGDYQGIGALKPGYQAANIACAISLAENFMGEPIDTYIVDEAIVTCPVPGRFDVRRGGPLVLVDACHNPQSVEAFLVSVRRLEKDVQARPALLCAILADKDCKTMVEKLAPEFPEVYICQTKSSRCMAAHDLAELFEQVGVVPKKVYHSCEEAVEDLRDTNFVAAGSITLAGEIAGLLTGKGQGRGHGIDMMNF